MEKTITDHVAFLTEAKNALNTLESAKSRQEELELTKKKQAKVLAAEKKTVEDSVNNTIKKRKDELTSRYDSEISKVQDAIKKIKNKREKAKQASMKERIAAQLEPLKAENKEMNDKVKAMFKQAHVPAFCNTTFFYSLYFPRTMKEILVMLITFVICCVAIPCGIFALLPEKKTWILVLIYLAVIVVFGGIYIVIGNVTKDAHKQTLLEAGQVRRAIEKNRKKMRSITRGIRREKNEDHYDLSEFDIEIAKKEQEKAELTAKKEEALSYFNNTTKPAITEEIVSGSREKITKLEAEHTEAEKALMDNAAFIKSASLALSNDYESYIGKDFMQADKLDALIRILKGGQAANITEAETLYREQNTRK